jgi:hypothetical protein
MARAKSPIFNLRTHYGLKKPDIERIERVYDAVNLLCLTTGPDPFATTLTSPLADVISRAQKRFMAAYEQDMLKPPFLGVVKPEQISPRAVGSAAERAITALGDSSVKDLFLKSRRELGNAAVRATLTLREQGFQIPVPEATVSALRKKLFGKAIDELVRVTKRVTLSELFTTSWASAPQPLINAILGVKAFGMFRRWLNNDRCWSLMGCYCERHSKSWCVCSPEGGEACCSVLSDTCPL